MQTDRRKIALVSVLVAIPLILLIALLNAPTIVTVTAPNGSTIGITNQKGGTFKKAGTTKVTKLFFKQPDAIYISAISGDKQTISSIKPKRFAKLSVNLNFTDTIKATKITDGAVVNAIFDGTEGQGIVSGQNTLVNFSTVTVNEPLKPQFAGLPYIQKINWYDSNNFVYLTDDGIGQFINGVNKGYSGVATSVRGKVNVTSTNDFGSPRIRDMSKQPGKPLVLMSDNNIFTADDFGSRLNAIVSFKTSQSDTALFTSGNSIFKVTSPILTDSEGEDELNNLKPAQTIEEYSYTGKLIHKYAVDDGLQVLNVVKRGDVTYVLTYDGLHTVRGNTPQKESLYFNDPAGMVLYKGQVLVLANNGLWKISDNGSFQLINRFTANGIGLAGSLTIDPNGQLIFGTRPANDSKDNSATFSLSF